jgi:hypothetical protein
MKSIFSKYTNLALAMVASAMFSGCALDAVPPPVNAELMIINTVPAASSTVPLVAGTAPRLQINVDGVDLLADSMQSGSFRGYIALQPGTRNIKLTASNAHRAAGITLGQQFHSYTFNGEAGKYASTFLFTENNAITSITVNDNLALPDTGRVHVRVVNLTASPIDVFALTIGTVGTVNNVASTPVNIFTNVAPKTASAFTPIRPVPLRAGSALPTFVRGNYTFQIRAVGATTNLATLATSTNNTNANTATLENQRIYTIVVRPGATATAAPVVFGFFNNRI